MAKIREEVRRNCEIHGKITASAVNSEHGSEAHIAKHLALLFNRLLFTFRAAKRYEQQLKSRNVKLTTMTLWGE